MTSDTQTPDLLVLTGPMFAGKTSALITEWHNINGKKLAFKHAIDKRYETETTEIISHDKLAISAIPIQMCSDITDYINKHCAADELIDAVFIDEGQFFPDINDWFQSQDKNKIHKIVVSGLDYDIFGKPFTEQFSNLMEAASILHTFSAACHICDNAAQRTQFMDPTQLNNLTSGNVLIGGESLFQPACVDHFMPMILG